MKNTFYFPHDYHARHDPKLEKLFLSLGYEGMGIYWCLIEMLYEQGGYLSLKDLPLYSQNNKELCERITKVVNDYGLFDKDKDKFWSKSCLERLAFITEKSKKASESALVRWGSNANALRTQSEGNAIKESKVKEKKVNSNTMSTEVDPYIQVFNAWNERMPWKINSITTSRRRALSGRLKEPAFKDNFHTILTKILESDFLSGRKPTEGHGKWYASFDWVIKNDTNYQKILEGRYENKETEQ